MVRYIFGDWTCGGHALGAGGEANGEGDASGRAGRYSFNRCGRNHRMVLEQA